MKQYFLKHIPDGNEIKGGTKCLYGEAIVECQSDYAGQTWMNQPDVYKPVKLFLCSRNINVGDKVQHISGVTGECMNIEERGEGNRTTLFFKEDTTPQHVIEMWLDEFFKIIGEVSPEALSFAKEGDEFDEDEVRKHLVCYGPSDGGYCFHCSRGQTCGSEEYVYQLKGPCGHLH